ncbi:efflux RND transporter periplasmic adaptor subunit [Lentisphaerota bacterium ZTH]|nr:efflux RND transporter periplasmic adaptor subunit [Lentisphaerota bacterium]WET05233.1 efflux RND transporter periplasmic adaptor subunit [Lentisphaerota bacterium ZTH]
MRKLYRNIIIIMIIGCTTLSGIGWFMSGSKSADVNYMTCKVERGSLLEGVSATGTVEPEEVVDVGAQVGGRIMRFGKDSSGKLVDYGSVVKKGTVLAHIDDTIYTADVKEAAATEKAALANLVRSQAQVKQNAARFGYAIQEWNRQKKLVAGQAVSVAVYDDALSKLRQEEASYKISQAEVKVNEAQLASSKASLARARQNLDYCTITSPVDGVVIDRRVNIGQTVVASLNAPSLFLIAKDLKRMQVWVAVNEADIGNIKRGQKATFTVDAFPGKTFTGIVEKIRLNASMTQNVVNYTVEVNTDNSSGKLLPYLTADVTFIVAEKHNAIKVPNSALRWRPTQEIILPKYREDFKAGFKASDKIVWKQDGKYVIPVRVKTGVSDSIYTEITSPQLQEGTQLVTGTQLGSDSTQSSSPFSIKLRGGKKA